MRFWPFLLLGILVFALTGVNEARATPAFQAAGVAEGRNGAIPKLGWPAHQIDDIALLFIESDGGDTPTVDSAGVFVAVANSPQTTGTAGAGTQLTVFWARATSAAMPSISISPNQHVYAQIITYRGVSNTGNPWDVTGGGVKAVASTSITVTGVTTTVPDTLIVQAVARDNDSAAAAFSAQTNANLTSITERSDAGTTAGTGGGFAVWDGVKATAGATGDTTATVTSSINAFLTIALKPQPLQPPIVAKDFSPASIATGGTSTLTVTLANPNAVAITGAAFTDSYPTGMTNAATPSVLSSNCGSPTITATAGGGSLVVSGATIAGSATCTVHVNVTATTTGTNSTGTVTTTNAGSGTAATATLTVASAVGSFNAYETSTTPATAPSGVIRTKVAGAASFSLDLIALNSARTAILSTFTGAVKVELLNSSSGGTLDGNGCNAGWTHIQTLATNPVFAAGDNGRKTTVSFQENNAWRNVRVRISYPDTGTATAIGCSSDNFAIRPSALGAYAAHDNWETVGASLTLNNSGISGGEIHKAGRNFTLVATGYNAASIVTGNYDGTPTVVSVTAVTPATITGNFSVGTFVVPSSVTGTVRSDTATYDEVGAVSLILQDQNFAAVDASDGSTTAERYVSSPTITVGRFVPDHFIVTPGTLTNRRLLACSTASSFTYAGEQLRVAFTLTARNGLATPAITRNYTTASGLAKLDGAVIANFGFGAVDLADATPPAGATALTANLGLGVSSGAWVAGEGSFTADLGLNRSAAPDGPYESFRLGILPADTDGVTVRASDLNLDTTVPPDTNDRVLVGSSIVRYGRLRLQNAYGSERLPLDVPLQAQYWAGSAFINNNEDSCTVVSVPAARTLSGSAVPDGLPNLYFYPLVPGKNELQSADAVPTLTNSPFSGGKSKLHFSAPAKRGWLDIILNVPNYLIYNWGNCSGQTGTAGLLDDFPCARATFGIYGRAKSPIIYRRENY